MWLGASAGSKPEQDFAALGVELKTIPIDSQGRPLETTFVCVAPLTGNSGVTWESSHVRHKLQRVLWIPVEGDRAIPLAERRVGAPLLWSPNEEEDRQLRMDWEELMDLIVLGQVERITARHGEVLQLRPKAANSKALTEAIGARGEPILTLPRGFYLKKNFTAALLARHFLSTRLIFCSAWGLHIIALSFCRTLNNVICMDNRSQRLAGAGHADAAGDRARDR
jgi:DNA mismatch repair protein MutH